MKVKVQSLDAKGKAGDIELNDEVFGIEEIRGDILQRCVTWQLAKRRAGTHKVQTRNENSRTGKKMYKQKGTGRARHGARTAPQFRGGGKAFGPVARSHAHDLPKKVRALALRHALSSKAKDASLIVVDEVTLAEPKTKVLVERFGKLGLANALIIGGTEIETNFQRAARAIPNVDVLPVQGINVYDILRREKLVLTKAAVDALEARFK